MNFENCNALTAIFMLFWQYFNSLQTVCCITNLKEERDVRLFWTIL